MPACPKCGNKGFATTEITPVGSNFKLIAVHCASATCQAVVSTTEFYNSGAMLKGIETKLTSLERKINDIERKVLEFSRKMR